MTFKAISTKGLEHKYAAHIARGQYDDACEARYVEMQKTAKLDGFRPGKIPIAHLKRLYKDQVQRETLEGLMRDTTRELITEKQLRPATQPEVSLKKDLTANLTGTDDIEFEVSIEVMPDITLADFSRLKFVRPTVAIDDKDVARALDNLAHSQTRYVARKIGEPAQKGDKLVLDFIGRVNGEAFEGGKAEAAELVLGSGQMLHGFEDQLTGQVAGATPTIKATLPKNYPLAQLAGKQAEFDVTIRSVLAPQVPAIDEALAKSLGMDTLEKLRDAAKKSLAAEAQGMCEQHLKQDILRQLDDKHKIDLPPRMVQAEAQQLLDRYKQRYAQSGQDLKPDEEKTLTANCDKLAQQRIKLALLISDIGAQNNIEVTQDEVKRAMDSVAAQQANAQQALQQLQKNPQAAQQLRAQLFEDKVVDLVRKLGKVEDKPMSLEQIMQRQQAAAAD